MLSLAPALIFILHWVIIIGLGLRVILTRRPTGSALAWMFLITSVPIVGAVFYVLMGELWLPARRIREKTEGRAMLSDVEQRIEDRWELRDDQLPPIAAQLNAQASRVLDITALHGNRVELFDACVPCLDRLIEDIDAARTCVNIVMYIWDSKGKVGEVEAALVRAAQRGVRCRVLLDSVGSHPFLTGRGPARLRAGGIEVVEALPVGRLRLQLKRIDIRNHRKIIVVDHQVAYTGSMNMVDPAYFKAGKGVGEWVDVMARSEGPVAQVLEMVVATDWGTEDRSGDKRDSMAFIDSIRAESLDAPSGDIPAQIVPSGPDQSGQIIQEMLITLMYNAQRRLIITTPYFIPSEPMLAAIRGAAHRGVRVTLVVPMRIDSLLVRHASKAYFEDLLDAGVEIYQYRGGLLHSKTVTADDELVMLGSVNMDKRSFGINFEISMFIYHTDMLEQMRSLQERYIADSTRVEPDRWKRRSVYQRVIQNTTQLFSPVL